MGRGVLAAGSAGRGPREGRWRDRALVLAVLAAALALRVWFGAFGIDRERFFDERYVFENVGRVLDGHLRPANAWFPSLAHLPQAALLAAQDAAARARDWPALAVRDARGRFTGAAWLTCRLLQALVGTLGVYLTYRLGRRLFDFRVGLLAAALLCLTPFHVKQSGYVKPDVLLVVTLLAACAAALDLYRLPDWPRYLAAGAWVGIVASTKPNGVPIALVVALASSAAAGPPRARLIRLGAAAAASGAVFVLLNPYFGMVFDYLRRNARIHRTEARGAGRVVAGQFEFLLGPTGLGWLVGTAALAGLLLLGARAARGRPRRFEEAVLPAFFAGYSLFLPLITGYDKTNLYLPLTAFTALAAGWLAVVAWDRWIAGRGAAARRLAAAAAGAAVAASLAPGLLWIYAVRVPTTLALAARALAPPLRTGPASARLVYQEVPGSGPAPRSGEDPSAGETPDEPAPTVAGGGGGERLVVRKLAERVGLATVRRLAAVPAARLDLADAEVYPTAAEDGPDGEFYRRRRAGPGAGEVLRFVPGPFLARGPALTVLLHPWKVEPGRVDLPLARAAGGLLAADLPAPPSGAGMASLVLVLPRGMALAGHARLAVGGEEVPLHPATRLEERMAVVGRFAPPPAGARLALRAARGGEALPDTLLGQLRYWRRR